MDKLFHWNCEWLTRPNYAISELADTLYANMATLAEYRDKVFARQPVDVLINKARPIARSFKDLTKGTPPPLKNRTSATSPLMKFVEDGTLQTLSKHLFATSGTMYSIATHLMTLQTLFSHPAEFARRHRKSPEVQGFKQNPSCESMVAYIASQTLTHNEIVAEDQQGANIWDILTQRVPSRETRAIAPLWDIVEEQGEDAEEPDEEDNVPPPSHQRARCNILDEEDDELQEEEPFNMPKSSAEHALFITQQDSEPYHEPGTLSRSQKCKTPATSKKRTLTTNIWASFGLHTDQPTTSTSGGPSPAKKCATTGRGRGTRGTTRGRGQGARGKHGKAARQHIFFE